MIDNYVYRPRSGWAYIGVIVTICSLAAASFFIANRIQEGFLTIVNSLAVTTIFWVLVVRPKIVFTYSGIEIHNPFRTAKVGWLSVQDFHTKYAFTVVVSESKFASWAAPAANRFNTRKFHEGDYRGTGLEGRKIISPSDSPRSESGVALILALKYKEEARLRGTSGAYVIKKFDFVALTTFFISGLILWQTLSQ